MKKFILPFFLVVFLSIHLGAQVYIDQFDNGSADNTGIPPGVTSEEANDEWTLIRDNSAGIEWNAISYQPHDQATGVPMTIDISETNKIFVKAKASNIGAQFRLDVLDADGFVTSQNAIVKTLLNDYTVLEFDFTDKYVDAGWGGTSCTPPVAGQGECPVDPTAITTLLFFINPGQPMNGTTVILDFISVGTEPVEPPMSDVFQELFDDTDSTINWVNTGGGFSQEIVDSKWIITGDGTNEAFNPMTYGVHNQVNFTPSSFDLSAADNKVFVRMRSNLDGVSVRVDVGDNNGFISTQGSVTKVINTEWKTYEYNFTGVLTDLGWGGTPCVSEPPGQGNCPVNPETIQTFLIFINPGVEAFAGQVEIEYISAGIPLEPVDPGQAVAVYDDHFDNGDGAFITSDNFLAVEDGTELSITGDGTAGPFSAVAYSLHNQETLEPVVLDVTGNHKVFIKAKSSLANGTLLRVDLMDTLGFITSAPSFTRTLDDNYSLIELDFDGQYTDLGFSEACPTSGMSTCPVDPTAIANVLFYVNPVDGGFEGTVMIDYISFGAPLGAEIDAYADQFDDDDRSNWGDAAGFSVVETDNELILTGDGGSMDFTASSYTLHDQQTLEPILANLTPNNKVWIKAKSSVDMTTLRIDLIDEMGFVTNENANQMSLSTDYQIYEYDFTGRYVDAGFGGAPCTDPPCLVDASRIGTMLFYVDPGTSGFTGTVTIDWVSTIEPLEDLNPEPVGILNYADDFNNDDNSFHGDATGLVNTETNSILTITGDGTGNPYGAIVYEPHDQDANEEVRLNVEGGDGKVFIFARSSVADIPFRIDLIDLQGYTTNSSAIQPVLPTEFDLVEYDFTGRYLDAGFSPDCPDGTTCPVDGKRIESILFYPDPDNGGFEGTIDIDWISFGSPLTVAVIDYDRASSAKIYPMPAGDEVVFEMGLLQSGNVTIEVFDMLGQKTAVQHQSSQVAGTMYQPIDLSQLSSGMYILTARVDGTLVASEKITKK